MRNEDQTGYDLETLSTAKIYSNIKYNNFSVDYGVTTDRIPVLKVSPQR
jgi:hypothetical protein